MSAERSSKKAKIEGEEYIQAEQQSFNIWVWMHDSGRLPYCMVEASDTIESVRAKVRDKEGVYLDQYTLFQTYRCEMVLEDSKTISHYGIEEGDVMFMKKMIKISVSGLGGETITLDVGATDCIEHVKDLIQDKTGIPPTRQRLISGLDVLEDNMKYRKLSDYNIQTNDELTMVLR